MKEKARHILCLAFLKSGEKNMEKILIYQVKEKEGTVCRYLRDQPAPCK